jgi:hypothetical protein
MLRLEQYYLAEELRYLRGQVRKRGVEVLFRRPHREAGSGHLLAAQARLCPLGLIRDLFIRPCEIYYGIRGSNI